MTEINQTQPPSDEGDESQFEDYQGELRVPDDVLVFSRLLTAPVLRGAAALFVGLFILSRPRSAGLFAVALGVFLIIWAAGETMDARRKGDRSWLDWLKVAGLLLVATVLVIWPDATKNVVGRIAGFALIGYALHEAYDRR